MADWKLELQRRLAPFGLPAHDEMRIIEELSRHLDDRVVELERRGRTIDAARREALSEISDDELARGGWGGLPLRRPLPPPPVDGNEHMAMSLMRDLRFAARMLWRHRSFSAAAVLALALGIGGTTAIFAAIDAVLLRPMPFPHADRLFVPVSVNTSRNISRGSVAFADVEDWRRETGLFAEVAVWRPGAADLTGTGDPERVPMAIVSDQFFRLTGVIPVEGRTLVAADHAPGAREVVVISHGLWQRRFGGTAVVGARLTLGGVPREIVGVLPARQVWPSDVALFVPMNTAGFGADVRERRDNMIFNGLARLQEGVSPEQAGSRMAAMAARIEQDSPEQRRGWTTTIIPLRDYIVDSRTTLTLYVLLGAVTGVLLIACANVATLALVRGSGRARELAVRVSLGASRRRLIQQLCTEGVVLAATGVVAGVGLAMLIMQGLVAMAPPEALTFAHDVRLNGRVLIAAALAGGLAALIAGLIPALSISTLRVGGALRDGSGGSGIAARTAQVRNALVVAEIAATVVLVTGSALLIRSFDRLTHVDAGVSLDRVVSGRVAIPGSRYDTPERRRQFADALLSRLRDEPEIEHAAMTSFVPAGAGGFGLGRVFLPEGRPEPPTGNDVLAAWNTVTPGYFETLGINLGEGRSFDARDRADTTPVMIVSSHFAERMFPGESAVGKRVRSWRDENIYREIVGVADEVRYWGLAERERAPLVYVPYAQDSQFGMLVVARSRSADAGPILQVVRRGLSGVDPLMAIAELRTLEASASRSINTERYSTLLLSVLATVALLLSGLGNYAVTSYVFTLRRREMGIRAALGATRANLHGLVFRHGFALALSGLTIGVAGAVAFTRWLESLLFDTTPADPAAWATMIAVIVVATGLACLAPARRASTANPTIALKAE